MNRLNYPFRQTTVLLAGLCVAAVAVASAWYIDRPVACWVDTWSRDMRELADSVTWLGEASYYVIALSILATAAWIVGRRKYLPTLLYPLITLAISGILVNLIKVVLARSRPNSPVFDMHFAFFRLDYELNGFPSGHAATMGAVCMLLSMFWPRFWPMWLTFGLVVASSRIFTLSHYLSDVIVGGYFGAIMPWLVLALWRRLEGRVRPACIHHHGHC